MGHHPWHTDLARFGGAVKRTRHWCAGPGVPCKGSLFQQVKVLPRQRPSQPGSYPSGRGGNETAGAWEKGDSLGLSASWQAVTRVNTEAAPKVTMRRPTLPGLGEGWHGRRTEGRRAQPAAPGWWVTACQQGATINTGSPGRWPFDEPTGATGTWPMRVAEGLVVPRKPGNAGGGKGPWFQDADEAAREEGD